MSASLVEIDKPLCTNNYDSFKRKKFRIIDILKFNLQILFLKTLFIILEKARLEEKFNKWYTKKVVKHGGENVII